MPSLNYVSGCIGMYIHKTRPIITKNPIPKTQLIHYIILGKLGIILYMLMWKPERKMVTVEKHF